MPNKINHLYHQTLVQQKPIKQHPKSSKIPFNEVLSKATNQLTISNHARKRLEERNIKINDEQWGKISKKLEEARKKGVKDSLVILNHATLLVSAKNNTVITALDREEATARIFTNINGTILMNE